MTKNIITTMLFALACHAFGVTVSTKNSGSWTIGSNWNGNSAPSVPLANNSTVTISGGDSIFYASIFNVANKLTINVLDNAVLVLDQGIHADNTVKINVSPFAVLILNGAFVAKNNASVEINGTAQINGNLEVEGNAVFTIAGKLAIDGNVVATSNNNKAIGDGILTVTGAVSDLFSISSDLKYNATSLPIELQYFTVDALSSTDFYFEWQTASEIDNEKFITQYSENATDWEDVFETSGGGTTSASITYRQTISIDCYGEIAYFRLKQVDFTGEISCSNIVSVKLMLSSGHISADAFPNPATDHIIIDNHDQTIESLYIFDADSKLVDEVRNVKKGKVKYSFGTQKEGIYYVGIKSLSGTDVKRIVVQP